MRLPEIVSLSAESHVQHPSSAGCSPSETNRLQLAKTSGGRSQVVRRKPVIQGRPAEQIQSRSPTTASGRQEPSVTARRRLAMRHIADLGWSRPTQWGRQRQGGYTFSAEHELPKANGSIHERGRREPIGTGVGFESESVAEFNVISPTAEFRAQTSRW